MQYVEGHTLHDFPRSDRKLLVRLMVDAARAVEYAHGQGVVHRDLKPENLMATARVRPDGKAAEVHVWVMDFGLARVTEGASNFSVSGLVVGTPAYRPPEQAAGERVDARADVYALGATLYELLWALAQDIYAAYMDGRLNDKYFLPFGLILQGTPNYPGMGWKEVSALLEPSPRLRGPVAYVCARRYDKKGDRANARMFLQSALADAAREPAYPLLRRLAQAEMER